MDRMPSSTPVKAALAATAPQDEILVQVEFSAEFCYSIANKYGFAKSSYQAAKYLKAALQII